MARRFVLVLAVLLVFPGSVLAESQGGPGKEPAGKAPPFSAVDVDGREAALQSLLTQYPLVIVNFWGLRCGACIAEMPSLNKLQADYREDLVILGVNVDGIDAEMLRAQIKKIGLDMRYRVIPDPEMRLADLFRLSAAPLTIVIDSSGAVRYVHENYQPGDEAVLEETVRKVLAERKKAKG